MTQHAVKLLAKPRGTQCLAMVSYLCFENLSVSEKIPMARYIKLFTLYSVHFSTLQVSAEYTAESKLFKSGDGYTVQIGAIFTFTFSQLFKNNLFCLFLFQ